MERINKPKPILDACCGGKMFYFNKEDDRVLSKTSEISIQHSAMVVLSVFILM